jgi:hypothetical protein
MSTATSLAIHRIPEGTVRTGHNFDRKNEPRLMPDNLIKIANT